MATIDAAGIAMANSQSPSHVQGAESDQLIFMSKLLQQNPFMLNEYFRSHGNYQTTLTKVMPFIGKSAKRRVSFNPITSHWEKPPVKSIFTVGTIGAGANANEAIITLTASDMANDNGSISSLPRIKDEIQAKAGGQVYRIIAKNTAVNPNTITIQGQTGIDPQDEIIAGDVCSVFSNISGEGTNQNKALRPRRYEYQNTFQIVKDTDTVTGSNLTTQVRFQPVPGTNLLWMDGLKDMELRHQYQKGTTWMFGQQVEGWTEESELVDETMTIRGTQGLLGFIQQSGYNMQYDPNDVDINDMYALANHFSAINLPTSKIMLAQGYAINQKIERSVGNKLSYEWVIGVSDQYVEDSFKKNWGATNNREYNAEGAFINLGLKGFALGQFTFMQTSAPEFSNMQGMGAIGYNDWMVAFPIGDVSVTDGTGLSFQTSYVGYEVRGAEGYTREDELWMQAGAGGGRAVTSYADFIKTSPLDGVNFYVRTEMAAHFALGNQMAAISPISASS